MQDDSKFTRPQKNYVHRLDKWDLVSVHSNGDITIMSGNKFYRITKEGEVRDRWGGSRSGSVPVSQPKLGWVGRKAEGLPGLELPSEIDVKPIKPAKKYEFEPEKKYEFKPAPTKTICQANPECCQPRDIKAVFLDADHTIWDLQGTAASVTGKLQKVDDNTVIEVSEYAKYSKEPAGYQPTETEKLILQGVSDDERALLIKELEKEHGAVSGSKSSGAPKETPRTTIKLDPTFRQTLDELDARGIPASIISLNTPGSVKRILKEFGLDNRFAEIRDSYENKGKVFKELTHRMGICQCDALFVDDNRSNTDHVAEKCGVAIQIGAGKDIEKTIDILQFIKEPK